MIFNILFIWLEGRDFNFTFLQICNWFMYFIWFPTKEQVFTFVQTRKKHEYSQFLSVLRFTGHCTNKKDKKKGTMTWSLYPPDVKAKSWVWDELLWKHLEAQEVRPDITQAARRLQVCPHFKRKRWKILKGPSRPSTLSDLL